MRLIEVPSVTCDGREYTNYVNPDNIVSIEANVVCGPDHKYFQDGYYLMFVNGCRIRLTDEHAQDLVRKLKPQKEYL